MTDWLPKAVPVPVQYPAQAGMVAVDGARLHYWDIGGSGPAVILLHPATGSDRIWLYQQPVFAAAGYRVIAYSRSGHAGSDPVRAEHPGSR